VQDRRPIALALIAAVLLHVNGTFIPFVSPLLDQIIPVAGQSISTKLSGVQLLVVHDSQAKMVTSQHDWLDGKAFADWRAAHCSKSAGSPDYAKIDKDEKPDALQPVFRDLWAVKKDTLPSWVVSAGGRVKVNGPLPVDWSAASKELSKVAR